MSRFLTMPLRSGTKAVRVRYAPSPTGKLHLGGLRTALYNKLFAEQNQGVYVLRIEDTDRKRLIKGSVEDIHRILMWTGLSPHEGPHTTNSIYGSYIQSERLHIYKQYLSKLQDMDVVYPCFCSSETLDKLNAKQKQNKQPMKYNGQCRHISTSERKGKINQGQPHTFRFRNECQGISFRDAIYGIVSVEHEHFDDFILVKSDGWPTYHFANVVDDIEMEISHVIRGQEWLTSTPKHLMLYNALKHTPPQFVHLPLILSASGSKLSKRDNSTAVEWYLNQGYQPETIINAVALLGWTPQNQSAQCLNMKQLVQQFNLHKVHKAPAKFDPKKIDSLNRKFIKQKYKCENIDDIDKINAFRSKLASLCQHFSNEQMVLLSAITLDRITTLKDIITTFKYLFDKPDFVSQNSQKDFAKLFSCSDKVRIVNQRFQLPSNAASNKNRQIVKQLIDAFSPHEKLTQVNVKECLRKLEEQYTNQQLYHLLRYCISGRSSGPGADKILSLLGRKEVIQRLALWL